RVSTNDVLANDALVGAFWRKLYEGVDRANALLSNIDKPDMDESRREVIRGEALFLRAYYYFLLVSNFGDVPLKLAVSTSPTETDYSRTPAKEVYAQIVKDMTEAEARVLPITDLNYGGRISKSAVQGILARVHLYMSGYPMYASK